MTWIVAAVLAVPSVPVVSGVPGALGDGLALSDCFYLFSQSNLLADWLF